MNTGEGLWLTSELWQAINQHAQSENMALETWLEHQLAHSSRSRSTTDDEDIEDQVLALTIEHFHRLALQADEANALANAIFGTIVDGEPHRVGPVGKVGRHYVLRRRASAVTIQIGEGKIGLPLKSAARLAVALDNTQTLSSALGKLAA